MILLFLYRGCRVSRLLRKRTKRRQRPAIIRSRFFHPIFIVSNCMACIIFATPSSMLLLVEIYNMLHTARGSYAIWVPGEGTLVRNKNKSSNKKGLNTESSRTLLLCILTSKRVLRMLFSGRNQFFDTVTTFSVTN